MIMRKKNNIEQSLSGCGDIVTVADLSDKNMLTAAREKEYLDLDKIFPCANPVRIEIGCGKGKFVAETAALSRRRTRRQFYRGGKNFQRDYRRVRAG